MDTSERGPFPIGILIGALVGAIIGGSAATLLVTSRRSRSSQEIVANQPSISEVVRFGIAALALIRIANEVLSTKEDEDA